MLGRGTQRAFSLGFLLFGATYFLASLAPWISIEVGPGLPTSQLLDELYVRLHPEPPRMDVANYIWEIRFDHFRRCGHSLITLVVAFLGGARRMEAVGERSERSRPQRERPIRVSPLSKTDPDRRDGSTDPIRTVMMGDDLSEIGSRIGTPRTPAEAPSMTTDPDKSSREFAAQSGIRRVAILFAGGPAPAANAVISTAAVSFLRQDVEVVGILNGYSHLAEYEPSKPLEEGTAFIRITHKTLKRTRNSRGIMIGTARTNPGKHVNSPGDLADAEKSAPLKAVYEALDSLGVDALISIGGDDTLKTANKFQMYQEINKQEVTRRIAVVHVPKTIDNDYFGIDFTFGYFSAVDSLAGEIRNLLADAEATRTYYLAELMGRSAGWLAYGAAIAGEASLVLSVEDLTDDLLTEEDNIHPETGKSFGRRRVMQLDKVVGLLVETMTARANVGKTYGVIALAEGLAEFLPGSMLQGIKRDDHGHIAIADVQFGRRFAKLLMDAYKDESGSSRRVTPVQLGYEARCAQPTAFDVILGSQLGVGAYRALHEERKDGVMVSVSGQFELDYVPFSDLVDPETLITKVRRIERGSDFHRLARFLEIHIHG